MLDGQTLSAINELAMRQYETGYIYRVWDINSEGLADIFKATSDGYLQGGLDTQFAIETAPAGSWANIGTEGTFYGRDSAGEQKISTTNYQNFRVKRPWFFGNIRITLAALGEGSSGGWDRRYMLQTFRRDAEGITRVSALHWLYTLMTGARGWLLKLSQSTAPEALADSSEGHKRYKITIAQDGDRQFIHTADAICANLPIQLFTIATDAVVSHTGNADGIIESNLSQTELIVRLDLNRDITAASLNDNHGIRLYRQGTQYHAYGLYDMIHGASANFDGAGDATFPYGVDETGIDPATVGEWASPIVDAAGLGSYETALDRLFHRMYHKGAVEVGQYGGIKCATSLGVAQKLVREIHELRRYAPGDAQDARPKGYTYYKNGEEVLVTQTMPFGVLYAFAPDVMAMDERGKLGPEWSRIPGSGGANGTPSQVGVSFDTQRPLVQATLQHYYQRMILNRRKAGVLIGLDEAAG